MAVMPHNPYCDYDVTQLDSYNPASPNVWKSLVTPPPGNGTLAEYDLWRGTDSAGSSGPVFLGTAGTPTARWEGGGRFTTRYSLNYDTFKNFCRAATGAFQWWIAYAASSPQYYGVTSILSDTSSAFPGGTVLGHSTGYVNVVVRQTSTQFNYYQALDANRGLDHILLVTGYSGITGPTTQVKYYLLSSDGLKSASFSRTNGTWSSVDTGSRTWTLGLFTGATSVLRAIAGGNKFIATEAEFLDIAAVWQERHQLSYGAVIHKFEGGGEAGGAWFGGERRAAVFTESAQVSGGWSGVGKTRSVFNAQVGMSGGWQVYVEPILLADVISGNVFDLDARVIDSYPGSGRAWFNMTPEPADGANQSDYDMENPATSQLEFSGTPGQPNGHFRTARAAPNTSDRFRIDTAVLPDFLKRLHRTDAAATRPFTLVVIYQNSETTTSTNVVGHDAANSAIPNYVRIAQASSWNTRLVVYGDPTSGGVTFPTGIATPGKQQVFGAAMETSGSESTAVTWVDLDKSTAPRTLEASTADAAADWTVFRSIPVDAKGIAVAAFNRVLTDADWAELLRVYAIRGGAAEFGGGGLAAGSWSGKGKKNTSFAASGNSQGVWFGFLSLKSAYVGYSSAGGTWYSPRYADISPETETGFYKDIDGGSTR